MSITSEMPPEPRQLTPEEAREKFLRKMWQIIGYWENEARAGTTRDRISGAVFTILATIDGDAADIPAFTLTPIVPKEDVEFLRANGENWMPHGADIAGGLHEHFHNFDPLKRKD